MRSATRGLSRTGTTPRFGVRGCLRRVSAATALGAAAKASVLNSTGSELSISQGPDEPPLLPHTIPGHFTSIVSKYGDRPAVICRSPTATADEFPPGTTLNAIPQAQDDVYTYERLDLTSNRLGHSLRSLGVKKGDRVAVSLGNCAEFAALTYAIFKLGAILVPLNPAFNAEQVASALQHLGVNVLIVGAVTDLAYKPCRGRSNLPLLQALVPDLHSGQVEAPAVPTLKTIIVVDNTASHPLVPFQPTAHRTLTPFTTLLTSPPGPLTPSLPLAPSDTINIQFTSGTTSHPKAAMLTHTSLLNNGALIASRMRLTPHDRIVCPPPLFHCFGAVLGFQATAATGAALLLPSPAFDPRASLRMAGDHAATGLYGVATMFVAMLEAQGPLEAAGALVPGGLKTHLRTGIAAGSSVPEALMGRLQERLGLAELVICYGQTETSPVSCMTAPGDPLGKRTGSVGRAMAHTRVKVVDAADRGRVVRRGERGELAASGYCVMQGYWGDEERTRRDRVWERDGDGEGGRVWMYSGDEAVMDEEGYVAITGRIKDLIIRAGENIHPLEVENCLFQHPLVAEVSVVGVPDERLGETVGAFVVVHRGVRTVEGGIGEGVEEKGEKALSKEEVRDWVRRRLSSHLVPKHVFWVDEYPKTSSGKIQKFKLREMAREMVFGVKISEGAP